MIRRIALAGVLLTGLVAPLAAAAPASAGSGVGCTGANCSISLSDLIVLKGDQGGVAHVPLDLPPPPCLWEPIGDQVSGSNAIIDEWGTDPPTSFGVDKSVKQARELLKKPQVGNWYELPVNPAATPAGKQECLQLPLYYFAVAGTTPPAPPVPPRTLAEYAYNNMRIPLPRLTISPRDKGYVNLASYVWAHWPRSPTTHQQDAYKITASIPGGPTVTVWAVPAATPGMTISASGPGTVYSECGKNGSRYPRGQAPSSAGAGTPPDCGVLWQGPDATASIGATVTWTVTWGMGDLDGPGPNTLPPVTRTSTPAAVAVGEIQSINGG